MTSLATDPPLPPGACDCHTHVFLDEREFPFEPQRRYTPPPASIDALQSLHHNLGVERVVIVQPSVYGLDNAATLHALRVLGPGRARGVAVIGDHTSDEALDAMHAAGVRGVRVNLEIDGERDAPKASAWMRRVAARIAPRGWHVQVYASLPLLADCAGMLGTLPVPVVLDHHAGVHTPLGAEAQGMDLVLALVSSGRAYVKLSAPYRCSGDAHDADVEDLTRRFVQCNPDRMLWGSDWPHPRPGTRPDPTDVSPPYEVDVAGVLRSLRRWTGDDATFRKILVDNPRRLYGFSPTHQET